MLALEFGGTRVRAALVDRQGTVRAHAHAAAQAQRGADHVLAQARALAATLLPGTATMAAQAIGISAAGIIDRAAARVLAAQDTMPGWAGTDLRRCLGSCLGGPLPVVADNDANCALAGELWRGAHAVGSDALTVLLTLGTGLGGAIAHGAKVLAGATQRAGHFGSMRVWHARQEAVVPLESVVSGTGLMNLYHLAARGHGPRAEGGQQVAQWAADPQAAGHAQACAAWQEWVELLGGFLHDLHVALDPGLVIIGGGVLQSSPLWWEPLVQSLAARQVALRLEPAALGNDAGLVGAARLAWQALPG